MMVQFVKDFTHYLKEAILYSFFVNLKTIYTKSAIFVILETGDV